MEQAEYSGQPSLAGAPAPFTGREAELAWLADRVAAAARGHPRLCLVRAPAGFGKSRLVAEAGRRALQAGARVWSAVGHAGPSGGVPYTAIAGLLQELGAGPPGREALGRLWREARRAAEQEAPARSAAAAGRGPAHTELSRAFASGVLARAAQGTLVLLLDDLHAFDDASAELVAELATTVVEGAVERPVALAMLATAPPEPMGPTLRRLAHEPIAEPLELAGLDAREAEELLVALGLDRPAPQLLERLLVASDGSPLHLEHLARQLQRRDLLERRGTSWVARTDPASLGLPEVLRDAALDALGADAVDLLSWLAVFAEAASAGELAELAGRTEEEVALRLAGAGAAGLLVRAREAWDFRHKLQAVALRGALAPKERRRRHRRVAEWLAEEHPGRTLDRAHHWAEAWPDAPAATALAAVTAGARAAMAARAWRGAAGHFERALGIAAEAGGHAGADVPELHYRAGLAYFRANEAGPAGAHFADAVVGFAARGDFPGEVRARIEALRTRTALSKFVLGGDAGDLQALEAAVPRLGDEPELQVYALATISETLGMERRPAEAVEMAQRAVALARARGLHRMLGLACVVLGIARTVALELDGAVEALHEALRLARRVDDPWLEGLALQRLPMVLAWLGRVDETRGYLLTSHELAEVTQDWADYSLALGTRAALAVARGRFEEAEHMGRQAVLVARRHGYPWGGALAASAVAAARSLQGDTEGAEEALRLMEEPGVIVAEPTPEWSASLAVTRLRLRVQRGEAGPVDGELAASLLGALLALGPDVQTVPALCAIVDVARAVGDADLARRAAEAIAPIAERGVLLTASCDDLLPRALGVAAALAGDEAGARAHLERALDAAESAGARVLMARAHRELEAVHAAHDPGRAEAHAQAARLLETRLGLRSFGEGRAADAAAGREDEVLRGLAGGRSAAELALELLVSPAGIEALGARARERQAGAEEPIPSPPAGAAAARRREPADVPYSTPPLSGEGPGSPVIWVSDIAGSTALFDELGDVQGQERIRQHNRLVRELFARFGGIEVQHTGDGFIATFSRAGPAVECAVALQRALAEGSGEAPRLGVRVGIHSGSVEFDDGRLVGLAMNATAHICGGCEAAEIRISDAVLSGLDAPAPPTEDLGPAVLRGVRAPFRLHRICWKQGPQV